MYLEDKMREIFEMSDFIEADAEYIPLLSEKDEELMHQEDVPLVLPVLPLRNTVLFPGVVIPITAARDKSIKLIKEAYKTKAPIVVVAQKNREIADPGVADLFQVGTMATILKTLKMPDGTTTIIIQGKRKVSIKNEVQTEPYVKAEVAPFLDKPKKIDKARFEAITSSLKEVFLKIIKLSPQIPTESSFAIQNIESSNFLIHFIASGLDILSEEKQILLEMEDPNERAFQLLTYLTRELEMLELKQQIQSKVKTDMDKQQREYMLNQQLKTIQEELGGSPGEQEEEELFRKAAEKKWTADVQAIFDKEMAKLHRIHPMSPDYSAQLNYLNTIVELPWGEYSQDKSNLKEAMAVLNEDHFGLEKVKDRIIEHLAVLKLRGDMKSPIICLDGPPGVGKTSLGRSIARALGRKYVRMSLGGVRDEGEIRGHRKTYIGAMPGRIIYNLKKAQTSNPVFVLDEIDKVMGMNVNGDPSAALLEVLDPEQNTQFHDNFLDIDYDLSKVLFIATSNSLANIHPALRDRMEVIHVPGYIVEEKLQIAQRHLIPKQMLEHGLKEDRFKIEEAALEYLIEHYTRESGVRQMEKQIASVVRHYAKKIALKTKFIPETIGIQEVKDILGVEIVNLTNKLPHNTVGVVTGLAWTSVGGEILFIEVSLSPGKGGLTMTGNLGDVMKESATIAFQYIKSHAADFKISPQALETNDVHIHVPEGATPKDGPSAGIAIFTALCSVFLGKKVKADIAMTGEITLRGQCMPVGGIREKILAAKRAHITHLILCEANRPQIDEIPKNYLKGVKIIYIKKMEEVLPLVLEK